MRTTIHATVDSEFSEAARLLGEHMGERTARCLNYLTKQIPGLVEERSFPSEFLLGLGLAGQLRRWENLAPSAIAGQNLPAADFVLKATVRIWSGPELSEFVIALLRRVKEVFRERFLWCAERNNEVIQIQSEADDLDLDALADYLIGRAFID